MDVEALKGYLRTSRAIAANEGLPASVREAAARSRDELAKLFYQATGEPVVVSAAPALPPPIEERPYPALTILPAETPPAGTGRIVPDGEHMRVIPGPEPGAAERTLVVQAILDAATQRPLGKLSARLFELATAAACEGL